MKTYEELAEGLSFMGRKKLARSAKRNKSKLKLSRKRAAKKTAPLQKLMKRAQRRARTRVANHISGGRDKSSMSAAAKSRLEKQVSKRSGQVRQNFRKELQKARKDDRKRKR